MKIKVGISSCLLGNEVRYDGGHKLDRYLRDTLGQFVEWVPVCPEFECGLGMPREAMRLVGDPQNPRLITRRTGIDHTERMTKWAGQRIKELEKEDLCGFVFKSGSPSSGMRQVKVYDAKGNPAKKGVGVFAREVMNAFGLLPVEDAGRLHDPELRENFIERIFVYRRWQDFIAWGGGLKDLIDFHADHKLLILAHSPAALKTLGKLVAGAKAARRGELFGRYLRVLMKALKLQATVKKNVNVLQHSMGYFKKTISPDEKQELLDFIGQYRRGLIPLIVPVVLLNHYVRKYQEPYLKRQYYLHPHPAELILRNHV